MEVRIEATYGAAKTFIAAGLEGFNRKHMTGGSPKSFAVTVRDGESGAAG